MKYTQTLIEGIKIPFEKRTSLRLYAKTALKMFTMAKEAELNGDLNVAFVNYFKFTSLILELFPHHPEYVTFKKTEEYHVLSQNVEETVTLLESLKKTINQLHDEEMEKKKNAKVEVPSEPVVPQANPVPSMGHTDIMDSFKKLFLANPLESVHENVHSLVLKEIMKSYKVLFIDIRASYKHPNSDRDVFIQGNVVCIDPRMLNEKTELHQIENGLNPVYRSLLQDRDKVDLLVIIDECGNNSDARVRNLIDAFNFSFDKIPKKPPALLIGGMNNFAIDYPEYTVEKLSSPKLLGENGITADGSTMERSKRHAKSFSAAKFDDKFFNFSPGISPTEPPPQVTPFIAYPEASAYFDPPKAIYRPTIIPAVGQNLVQNNMAAQNSMTMASNLGVKVLPSAPPQPQGFQQPIQEQQIYTRQQQPLPTQQPLYTKPSLPSLPIIPQKPKVLPPIPAKPEQMQVVAVTELPKIDMSFTQSTSSRSLGACGLKNLDGTFRQDINKTNPLGTQGKVAESYYGLLRSMWTDDFSAVNPTEFKNVIGKFSESFQGDDQQDSQEFLVFLLDKIHEDLNRIKSKKNVEDPDDDTIPEQQLAVISWNNYVSRNSSVIVAIFQGQQRSKVVCNTCTKSSTTFNVFMYLSLPVPVRKTIVSLDECLKMYLEDELLDDENSWYCRNCKQHRRARKKLDLWRLPAVLIIQLKRFSFSGPFRDKIDTPVDFPTRGLDLSRFANTNAVYDLYAISNHYGGLNGGHYTAFCYNGYQRSWYHFDDSRVQPMDESTIKSKAAYLLFYVKRP